MICVPFIVFEPLCFSHLIYWGSKIISESWRMRFNPLKGHFCVCALHEAWTPHPRTFWCLTLASFSMFSSSTPSSLLPFRDMRRQACRQTDWKYEKSKRDRREGKKRSVWIKTSTHFLPHPLRLQDLLSVLEPQITFLSENPNLTENQPPGCDVVPPSS